MLTKQNSIYLDYMYKKHNNDKINMNPRVIQVQ